MDHGEGTVKTILVVDDSRIMRNIIKNTFIQLKVACEFLEASNGKEALKRLKAGPVDLILLDWNMPELSGLEFLRKVRAQEEYRKTPIIMVTSESARYNVIEALKNGATDYIVKPVNERIFLAKMWKLAF
ncbi:MAG: response regulator [Treponema sp.]|jgi:two-component system chemotaxis response regulator CheY|nr:response regulator [Treponema sp.]